jgi:cardiolipin synthase
MTQPHHHSLSLVTLIVLLKLAVMTRILLRPHRDPASRIAWMILVATFPAMGIVIYLLFGEVNIGKGRARRLREVLAGMPPLEQSPAPLSSEAEPYRHLFELGESINGFAPVTGNAARLLPDSNATIDAMVADIDAATDHVHLLFYIWLPDHNGLKIVEAVQRAALRGVSCRVMADALGSRIMIASPHWPAMSDAGVRVAVAYPIGNPLFRPLHGRIDLRNHRKIVVIDDRVTYCGSQNCADPEFLIKAKYAPWVDAVMRFEGPVVRENQYLFASDWMTFVDENLEGLLKSPLPSPIAGGFTAQVLGTGPTVRASAMSEVFETILFAARREVIITTPYYVPDDSLQNALCTAAYRGIDVTIIFPARNDSCVVGAASRSYYRELLDAGVKIYEYDGGLLHTKSLTVDGKVTLIGSANMDRRSFDLNYENNILLVDSQLTQSMIARQQHYLAHSHAVTKDAVEAWPLSQCLWNNLIATLGPLL